MARARRPDPRQVGFYNPLQVHRLHPGTFVPTKPPMPKFWYPFWQGGQWHRRQFMQAGALALGRLSERPWTGETVPADLIKGSVLRHTVGFGAQGEGQVEGVNGGSVLGQSQMTQLRVVAQEVDHLGAA